MEKILFDEIQTREYSLFSPELDSGDSPNVETRERGDSPNVETRERGDSPNVETRERGESPSFFVHYSKDSFSFNEKEEYYNLTNSHKPNGLWFLPLKKSKSKVFDFLSGLKKKIKFEFNPFSEEMVKILKILNFEDYSSFVNKFSLKDEEKEILYGLNGPIIKWRNVASEFDGIYFHYSTLKKSKECNLFIDKLDVNSLCIFNCSALVKFVTLI